MSARPRNAVVKAADIKRIHYGYIVAPEPYPDAGQPLPVSGFVIRHPEGIFLFDTGMSPFEDDIRQRYHPRISEPLDMVRAAGVEPHEVLGIANCHMHPDHAGGNSDFPGVPIYVQRVELELARTPQFTYPEYCFDFPDARLEVIAGERQVLPGMRLIPTPGHTKGHQSLLIDTDIGVVMLAGQVFNTTSEFSNAAFAERLDATLGDPIGKYPEWMSDVRTRNVKRALFAHDVAVWEDDGSDLGRPEQR